MESLYQQVEYVLQRGVNASVEYAMLDVTSVPGGGRKERFGRRHRRFSRLWGISVFYGASCFFSKFSLIHQRCLFIQMLRSCFGFAG